MTSSPTSDTSSAPSLSRCTSVESMTRFNFTSPIRLHKKAKFAHSDYTSPSIPSVPFQRTRRKPGSAKGPSALNDPANVEKIMVVSFGAFDRYYICWKDMQGLYQQGNGSNLSDSRHWLVLKVLLLVC